MGKLETLGNFILAIVVLHGALVHMRLELEKYGPGFVVRSE